MKYAGLILVIVSAAIMPGILHAQLIYAGAQEIRLAGGVDFDSAAGDQINLDVGYGFFFVDYIETALQIIWQDNDISSVWGLGGFVDYNYDLGTPLVPYVGGGLSFLNYDSGAESGSTIAARLELGLKAFVTDNMAITSAFQFDVAGDDIYVEDDGFDNMDMRLLFGLRYFF